MRQDDGDPVPNFIHKHGGKHVDDQLHGKIDGDEHGDFTQWNAIRILQRDKQQRNKIINDGLYNVSRKAGDHGRLEILFHGFPPFYPYTDSIIAQILRIKLQNHAKL